MMVMQQLQPEMKKIQTQYKDDRQKLNEELLKFYKENDISPWVDVCPCWCRCLCSSSCTRCSVV
jgi:YidC/Oxa1 family membrane protein insertase